MPEKYLESIALIEKIYRLFLDALKFEIQKIRALDLNQTQAMILMYVGDQKMSISEIVDKGHFVGSNVSYNVKKLIQSKYVTHETSEFDKRAVFISLTPKGKEVREKLAQAINAHKDVFKKFDLSEKDFVAMTDLLHKLEYGLTKVI